MKQVIGIILMLVGVVVGVYAGLWWAFIGGIVDIIHAVRAPDLVAMDIAIGIAKVIFAGAIGTGAAFIAIIPGYVLLGE